MTTCWRIVLKKHRTAIASAFPKEQIMLGIPTSWISWFAAVSLATFIISAVALPWLLARLPEDYFQQSELSPIARSPRLMSRVLYWTWRVLKNLLGGVLLLAGLVMLVIPGQGVLTIMAGLWLMDLPGKSRWERYLIGRPQVLTSINWIRQRAGRPPLLLNDRTK